MRVRDLLGGAHHIIAHVHTGERTIGLSLAGSPTLALEPGDAHRLRQLLGAALDQVLVERGARPARPYENVAAALRRLAEEVNAGRGPQYGTPLAGIAGADVPIVPVAVHDALCGVRRMVAMRTTPPTAKCPGCGLGYVATGAHR